MIEMERSLVELNDLPDQIRLSIFQKLDNISLLNSLMGVNRRLNIIVCNPIFISQLLDSSFIKIKKFTSTKHRVESVIEIHRPLLPL